METEKEQECELDQSQYLYSPSPFRFANVENDVISTLPTSSHSKC